MNVLDKIERLESLKKEIKKAYNINRFYGKSNLKISWGDDKMETTLLEDDRILEPILLAFKELSETAINEIEEEIKALLK